MPTKEEMQELIDSCSWEWRKINGAKGCIISENDNHIFLPYTEAMSGRGFLGISSGSYWTDNLNCNEYTGCMFYVWALIFGFDFKLLEGLVGRIYVHLIRPVLDDKYEHCPFLCNMLFELNSYSTGNKHRRPAEQAEDRIQ